MKVCLLRGVMKSVTAAILIKEDKILIAKRSGIDKQAGKWEFPGGTVEDGETHEQCLKREMKEEFDIDEKRFGENNNDNCCRNLGRNSYPDEICNSRRNWQGWSVYRI